MNTEVFITKNSETKDFYFSDLQVCKFNQLIFSMLYGAFLNNYDHWFAFEKPDDLDFSITIRANWSRDPLLFEIFQKLRDLELKEKCIIKKIREPWSFYATAKFEHNEREKMDFQDEQKRVEEFRNSNKLKEIEELYKEKAELIKKKMKNLKKKESSI
ncbi:MAG: hypothetical protein ACTSR8_22560 [Promethearchaeota archaeon]